MTIVAHDEDSMTNLFFSEVYRHEKMEAFLKLIDWRDHNILPFKVEDTELHQQVNFSEFGKPDAVIIVTDENDQKHIVIVEVKLGKYLESCISNPNGEFCPGPKPKSTGYNSKLNNQLTLRYRAMKSLSSIEEESFITELTHIAESPYYKDKKRRCKLDRTNMLFINILQDLKFYLVVLTSDDESPLSNDKIRPSDPCFPLFFDQHSNERDEKFRNLGSVGWLKCEQLFDIENNYILDSFHMHFQPDSENEKSSEVDKNELFVKGRWIIEFCGMKCHLSCQDYSYKIRHFRNGSFVVIDSGKNDREKYLALRSQINVLESAPQKSVEDEKLLKFWEKFFKK